MSAEVVEESTAVRPADGGRGRRSLAAVPTSPDDAVGYGGPRVGPGCYEPDRVPAEVLRYAGGLDTLPPGSPGKVGVLELEYARTRHGTEVVAHYQKSPLQIMRPLYYDPARPDMPYTYLMSTGAGVMQGDRLRTELGFGPGTSAHVTTTAYTRALRMDHDYAVAQTSVRVDDGAYVEYLPDPVVAFAGSRFYQRTRVTLAETGTLVLGEVFVAGRLARGERHAYAVFASDLEVRRPDGTPVAIDRVRLVPGAAESLAVLDGHDVLGTLYVLTGEVPATRLADVLHETLADASGPRVRVGVSTLPDESGAWVRVLGDETQEVVRATTSAWTAVRRLVTGHDAPTIRKS